MEPEKNLPPSEKMDQATIATLKDEGVEIEDSSRHVEENEFSPDAPDNSLENQGAKTLDEEAKKILAEMSTANEVKKEPIKPAVEQVPVPKPAEPIRMPDNLTGQVSSPNDPSIHQLRTFRMDAEEAVRDRHVTTADIAIAEQKKRESTPIEYSDGESSKKPFLIVTLLFIVILLGGAGYFYIRMNSTPTTAVATGTIRSIIAHDKVITVPTTSDGTALADIATVAKGASGTVGSVIFLALPTVGTTTQQIPLASVFQKTQVPEKLIRSLTNEYMFGIHIFDGSAPFIVLKTSFFQNAYPGMLDWEKDMRNDLLPLIQIARPDISAVDTNTDLFKDRVISNKDVRELDDASGVPIILYAFADKDTIVITTNEKSLKELLDKLLAVRVIQ